MKPEIKDAFREALTASLNKILPALGQVSQPKLVWRKIEHNNWQGEYINAPDISRTVTRFYPDIEQYSTKLIRLIEENYPQFNNLIGTKSFGQLNILADPTYLIRYAISYTLKELTSSTQLKENILNAVNGFERFFDNKKVKVIFSAQIINLSSDVPFLDFQNGIVLRQLSEKEISEIHGGSPYFSGHSLRHNTIHEYVLEGSFEEDMIFGNKDFLETEYDNIRQKLDRTLLVLRTFKNGPVGYEAIKLRVDDFFPLPVPTYGSADLYIPLGLYHLTHENVEVLQKHAKHIYGIKDPSMELACSRLSDSQMRAKPQDRLIDAVVGLESILLAGLQSEDRRGELKFRFSLHYSTLFNTPQERYEAFRIAKSLYDLRSLIAHGGILKDGKFKVADNILTLEQAAQKASEILREVIFQFLSLSQQSPYKQPYFWERQYFGL